MKIFEISLILVVLKLQNAQYSPFRNSISFAEKLKGVSIPFHPPPYTPLIYIIYNIYTLVPRVGPYTRSYTRSYTRGILD